MTSCLAETCIFSGLRFLDVNSKVPCYHHSLLSIRSGHEEEMIDLIWVKYMPTRLHQLPYFESPVCRQSRLQLVKGPELTAIYEIHELNEAFICLCASICQSISKTSISPIKSYLFTSSNYLISVHLCNSAVIQIL